jgi:four helix bundle protein
MSIYHFEELEVYKVCREFRKLISVICKKFPKDEMYLLTAQLKDSSRSVTANISEGFGRFHYQENIQFCRLARGSLMETMEHLIIALDENYISEDELERMRTKYNYCLKLINGYIAHLQSMKNNINNKQ